MAAEHIISKDLFSLQLSLLLFASLPNLDLALENLQKLSVSDVAYGSAIYLAIFSFLVLVVSIV